MNYEVFVNGQKISKVTKFKIKRSLWQMIKDKIEFVRSRRKLKGSLTFKISDKDFDSFNKLFE